MLDGSLPAPAAGGRVHGSIELRAGGSAANVALAAARLGARTLVAVGRVGADAAGRLVRDALEAGGVEPFLACRRRGAHRLRRRRRRHIRRRRPRRERSSCARRSAGNPRRGVPFWSPAIRSCRRDPRRRRGRLWSARERTTLASTRLRLRLVAAFGVDRFLEATARAGVLLANAEEARALTGLETMKPRSRLRQRYRRRLRQARQRRCALPRRAARSCGPEVTARRSGRHTRRR